jgi:cytochrome c5
MLFVGFAFVVGCGRPAGETSSPGPDRASGTFVTEEATASAALSDDARARVERFCGDCHGMPAPGSFPRERWPSEVRQGYDFYLASLRTDLPRPPEGDAIRYFQTSAPDRLTVPRAADRVEPASPLRFEPIVTLAGADTIDPAIAQVVAIPGREAGEGTLRLMTSDMRSGEIRRWQLSSDRAEGEVIARLAHPARVSPTVGAAEGWFVGDLGSFLPEDHAAGGVFFIPGSSPPIDRADTAGPTPIALRRGLGRVIGAVPFDWDGDGRLDLLVAEFGWRASGALRVLFGAGEPGDAGADVPFPELIVDPRHGVLDVRVADLDGDGREDVVAAFAQEHETVDAWIARGDGRYDHRELVRFPEPSWGSSGIDLADLDGDGDLDILHANGDTMDSGLARPTHGIRALFNDGAAGFQLREIALMPGVSQARAADLDGDGDLDVVATALHPGAAAHPAGTFDAVLWVEQGDGGHWIPRSIERDDCRYAAFTIADVDGDRRPDIVAGTWEADVTGSPLPALRVWLNRPASR